MDGKRRGSAPRSPPRSSKNRGEGGAFDIVTRTFDLVTSKEVIPYYILAIFYSFYYAPNLHEIAGPRPTDIIVFKVLPLIYLMELVRHPPKPICPLHDHARSYILFGLILCDIGAGVLVWDEAYVPHWAALTCLGYLCYSMAFYQYYMGSKWAKLSILLKIAIVAAILYLIDDIIISGFIVAHAIFLAALGFYALARLEICRTGPSYLGWAGAMLFLLSDVLLALNILVPSLEKPISESVVAMTFYLGHLGVALSTYTITQDGEKSSVSPHPVRSSRSAAK